MLDLRRLREIARRRRDLYQRTTKMSDLAPLPRSQQAEWTSVREALRNGETYNPQFQFRVAAHDP